MKKLLILAIIPFVILLTGCDEEPSEAIDAPDTYTLVGDINGLDLIIDWDNSSTTDIDGYRVYFDGGTDPIYEGTATTYTHSNPALGEYEIVAYRGSEESGVLGFDTEDYVETGTGTIYAFYASGSSGYGWDLSNGTGEAHPFTIENASDIDFYYDNDDDFTSADVYSSDFPNETGLYDSPTAYNSLSVVPSTSEAAYTNYVTPNLNHTYAVIIKKDRTYGNFAKIIVTEIEDSDHSATFQWTLQTVEKWRRVD